MQIKSLDTINSYAGLIYGVTNTVNGRQYVGQTTVSIKSRWKRHREDANKLTKDTVFCRAIRKYGAKTFVVRRIDTALSLDELNELEEFYIKKLKTLVPTGYNMLPGGKNHTMLEMSKEKLRVSHLGKHHTEETKEKCRQAVLGITRSKETRAKMSAAKIGNQYNVGRACSQETRDKIGIANRGNRVWEGRNHSEESKRKISAAKLGHLTSEETKQKISKANKGRQASDETKEKLRLALTGRKLSKEHKQRISTSRKGIKFSKEHIENLKAAAKSRKPPSKATRIKIGEGVKKGRARKKNDSVGHYQIGLIIGVS